MQLQSLASRPAEQKPRPTTTSEAQRWPATCSQEQEASVRPATSRHLSNGPMARPTSSHTTHGVCPTEDPTTRAGWAAFVPIATARSITVRTGQQRTPHFRQLSQGRRSLNHAPRVGLGRWSCSRENGPFRQRSRRQRPATPTSRTSWSSTTDSSLSRSFARLRKPENAAAKM